MEGLVFITTEFYDCKETIGRTNAAIHSELLECKSELFAINFPADVGELLTQILLIN